MAMCARSSPPPASRRTSPSLARLAKPCLPLGRAALPRLRALMTALLLSSGPAPSTVRIRTNETHGSRLLRKSLRQARVECSVWGWGGTDASATDYRSQVRQGVCWQACPPRDAARQGGRRLAGPLLVGFLCVGVLGCGVGVPVCICGICTWTYEYVVYVDVLVHISP